ncbi:hypothetical protein B0H12DRAFT_1155283, partial [Mycena haematopus]
ALRRAYGVIVSGAGQGGKDVERPHWHGEVARLWDEAVAEEWHVGGAYGTRAKLTGRRRGCELRTRYLCAESGLRQASEGILGPKTRGVDVETGHSPLPRPSCPPALRTTPQLLLLLLTAVHHQPRPGICEKKDASCSTALA